MEYVTEKGSQDVHTKQATQDSEERVRSAKAAETATAEADAAAREQRIATAWKTALTPDATPDKIEARKRLSGNPKSIGILPRANDVVIPDDKFRRYALDPQKCPDKAEAFRKALGYTKDNYGSLVEQIRNNLQRCNAVKKEVNSWETMYEVVMDIVGVNGKKSKGLNGMD